VNNVSSKASDILHYACCDQSNLFN